MVFSEFRNFGIFSKITLHYFSKKVKKKTGRLRVARFVCCEELSGVVEVYNHQNIVFTHRTKSISLQSVPSYFGVVGWR